MKRPVFRTQWGEWARSILRQYNEAGFNSCASLPYRGPHYVAYDRGEFKLRPYGPWAKYKYSFDCRPEFLPAQEEPLWTFMVSAH